MTELHTYETFAEELKVYNFKIGFHANGASFVDDELDSDLETSSPSEEIHRLAQQRIYDNPTANVSYKESVDDVLQSRPDLNRAYAAELKIHKPSHRKKSPRKLYPDERLKYHSDPSVKVHNAALQIQEDEGCKSYATAVHMALDRDHKLAAEYSAWSSM